ncbi:MAG: preprotein translocase subunit SecE [Eubacteriales bacterium]|nr:preprotein translocase subunit SecE [Eubacteriales bacterium]
MSDSKIAKQSEKKSGKALAKVKAYFKKLGKSFVAFFISMKAEIKRIMWPDRKRLIQSTATVLAIVVIAAVILFAVDTVLGKTLEAIGFYTPAQTTVETTQAAETTVVAETTAAPAAAETTQAAG